jgi:hypothetical protein
MKNLYFYIFIRFLVKEKSFEIFWFIIVFENWRMTDKFREHLLQEFVDNWKIATNSYFKNACYLGEKKLDHFVLF